MSRDDAERLIEAGGIVAAALNGDFVDTVTARTYGHAALDGRVVVRLVPAALGPAEDLAMEFLGFAPSCIPVDVGTGRRQAVGFPAWAVINDPANGHHALALVKDVERLARMARSKPGNAKEGFAELATQLGKSVPHFLPTFFEQAGRAFVAADNKLAAAVMFGRAREAERVYALDIDEERQRDVFLEFAFCGALTAKSLSQHAKDLAARTKPSEAYELFLRICLDRVAGGLPPYVGMAEDLRRLAQAAGLSTASEDERVMRGLLDSPSLPRAPLAFWKAYAPATVRLAKADVGVRARLLELFPTSDQEGIEAMWLDLLDATGAVAGLVEVEDQEGLARPRGGAAGWLARAVQWRIRGWRGHRRSVGLLQLVKEMAPRLRVESQPLDIALLSHWAMDVDLLDLCLSLDLEVAIPTPLRVVPLARWLQDRGPGRRDLAALAATDWARNALMRGVDDALRRPYGDPSTARLSPDEVRPLLEATGGRAILAHWLRRLADDAESAALPGLEQTFERLTYAALDVVLAVEPEAAARIASVDSGRALARTLRIGVFDELAWPALEEVVREFPKHKARSTRHAWTAPAFRVADAWPALILVSRARVAVVDADGVLLRHDVRLPRARPLHMWAEVEADWSDGQVLVSWQSESGGCGYWSGKPSEVFDIADHQIAQYGVVSAQTLPLPGGGRTGGGRPLLPDDKTFSVVRPVASDGASWWRRDVQGWREFDPQTGSAGFRSRPAFFEAAVSDGQATLIDHLCLLAPVPAGFAASPLGTSGGLVGWRVAVLPDGSEVGESVDGAVVRLSAEQVRRLDDASPAGAMQLPGGGPRLAVLSAGDSEADSEADSAVDSLLLWDGQVVGSRLRAGGRSQRYARGTALVAPLAWWHALRPRDVVGSRALRAVTDDQGRDLVTAASKGPPAGKGAAVESAFAAVRQILPGVTDLGLLTGVAGVLEIAVACARQAQALPAPAPCPLNNAD